MKLVCLILTVILLVGLLPIIPVAAAGTPDLTVSALTWTPADGQVTPGTTVTITATVKNEGDASVTTPFVVTVSFGTQEILRTTCTATIGAGRSAKVTFPAWKAVTGDKMIAVRIDADNAIAEKSEKNNTRQRNLRVASDRLTPAYNADAVTEAGMFDLTFNDDFTDLSGFDSNSTGREGFKWYIKRRWAQSDMTPSDYSVKNGIMTMAYVDDTYTIGASTVDCETHVGYTFNKGYIEARIRIPSPFESDSKTAIWSIPLENWAEGLTNGRYVEADWMEYFGKGDHYGTTLHDMETVAGGKNWYSQTGGSEILNDAEWHVMGWLWDEDILHCYIDGVEVHTQSWGKTEIPIPINDIQEGEIQFEGVFDVIDSQNMMLFIAGSSTMPMEFDYLRIWQHGGQAPTPPTTTTVPPTMTSSTSTASSTVPSSTKTTSTTVNTAASKSTSKTTTTVRGTTTRLIKPTATKTTSRSSAPTKTFPTAGAVVTTESTVVTTTVTTSDTTFTAFPDQTLGTNPNLITTAPTFPTTVPKPTVKPTSTDKDVSLHINADTTILIAAVVIAALLGIILFLVIKRKKQ